MPAFPGAEGFGAESIGGRGGRVIEVTNLNDSGPGSFRDACLQTGARTVVFRVSGTIDLSSRLTLREQHSFLTIAGQTAPGGGIQTKGFDFFLSDGVHDVVIRYMKFRPGHTAPSDWSKHGLGIYGPSAELRPYDILFDHCSIYWGPDEGMTVWGHVRDVTFQWLIIEGMEHDFEGQRFESSKSALFGAPAGEGSTQSNIALHHSYLVNGDQRNPRLTADGPFHIVNNVVYNWGAFATQIQKRGDGTRVNLIGNHYKRGPLSNPNRYAVGIDSPKNPNGLIYVRDNIGPFRPNNSDPQWNIVGAGYDLNPTSNYYTIPADPALQKAEPWPSPPQPIRVDPVADIEQIVLTQAGAHQRLNARGEWVASRDSLDQRAVADYANDTGTKKRAVDQTDSWWPDLSGGVPYADDDQDGMANEWETANFLDPNDPEDRNGDLDGDGYTNLEEFLNGTAPGSDPYEVWRQSNFSVDDLADANVSAPVADPDGDGVVNLMEYALALDPLQAGSEHLPVGDYLQQNGNSVFVFSFVRANAARDITYTVEVSDDLLAWQDSTLPMETVDQGNGTSTVRLSIPLPAVSKRFMRLRITR